MAKLFEQGELLTLTDISERLSLGTNGRFRVRYVMRTRGLEPVQRAGTADLYDAETAQRVAKEIKAIDAARPT